MSETTSAPAATPGAAPTPTVPAPVTSEPESLPVPAPAPTPVATTAVAVPGPTPASSTADSVPAALIISAPVSADIPATKAEPAQGLPAATESPASAQPAQPVVDSQKDTKHDDGKGSADEPQSILTKKFTDAEWKALIEFRRELPEIFAAAYPDKPAAKDSPVTIWGVIVDPANPQKDARVSVMLMKFLRARNLSVRDARDMLISTLRWRESFNIQAALEEDFPDHIFGNLGHIHGRDKEGRPVIYNIYGGNQDLKAAFGDVQRFIRWRVALMERSVDLLDFTEIDQTLQVHDYEGVSLTSRDANSKAAAAEASSIFQNHYPELLYKKFFVNVPTILNWIFWAFKPLLSANTLAKMSVVGTGHHAIRKALILHIDAKEIPERYGGEADAF